MVPLRKYKDIVVSVKILIVNQQTCCELLVTETSLFVVVVKTGLGFTKSVYTLVCGGLCKV